jgi:pilus assembly protein CpaB
MSARQLIVLVVAAIAAIGALLLIRGIGGGRATPTSEVAQPIEGEQILVAARDIGQGAALTPSDLGVALFPQGSISPTFVRLSAQPSAQAEYVGAVTRRSFARGEPITTGSVVQPEGRGFMAAQLPAGYRAVALEIEEQSAAGGYIQPNDRVDVIVTHKDNEGGEDQVRSEVVLEDIRVLAIGETTTPQASGEGPQRVQGNVAVLEVAAADARALAMAQELGDVSLALRGVQIETVGMRSRTSGSGQTSGAVRVHAYGSVTGGGQ